MNFYDKLPSRKAFGFVIVPIFTVIGLWYVFNLPEKPNKEVARAKAITQALNEEIGEYNDRDTDGDLLKDWEEFLYETDIELSDTDGDGLDDYQEVLDPIRDPLVADTEKGRYVATSTNDFSTTTPYYTDDPSLTMTDKFGRDIMVSFVQLQRADAFRSSVQDTVVQKVADAAIRRDDRQWRYRLDDLQIIENATIAQKQEYKTRYEDYAKLFDEVTRHDYLLLGYYSETKKGTYLDELAKNARVYKEFAEVLVSMQVPREIAQVHLELANNFYLLHDSTKIMSQAEEDPLGALVSANKYREDERAIDVSLQALSLYFEQI